jgi:hypothetical protein
LARISISCWITKLKKRHAKVMRLKTQGRTGKFTCLLPIKGPKGNTGQLRFSLIFVFPQNRSYLSTSAKDLITEAENALNRNVSFKTNLVKGKLFTGTIKGYSIRRGINGHLSLVYIILDSKLDPWTVLPENVQKLSGSK